MSPVYYGTLLSLSVEPPPAPTQIVIPCTVEWLLDGPWEVVGRRVVNRELNITVRPTVSYFYRTDPYQLCEALNRIYRAPVPPKDAAPPSPP